MRTGSRMDDLAAFLRAQWDAEEADARWSLENAPNAHQTDPSSMNFNPERVLREVEAKRRILDEHAIVHRQLGWLEDGEEDHAETPVCRRCVPKHSWYGRRADVPEGHCLTVRLLALPHADHPDYQEKWRP